MVGNGEEERGRNGVGGERVEVGEEWIADIRWGGMGLDIGDVMCCEGFEGSRVKRDLVVGKRL